MDNLIDLIYVEGDPMLTVVKLILILCMLEFAAVICSYLGGIK